MLTYKSRDGRTVDITDIEYGAEPEDSFVAEAYYTDELDDAKAKCPEAVLEELTEDYAGDLAERWHEHQVGRAEAYFDSLEDR